MWLHITMKSMSRLTVPTLAQSPWLLGYVTNERIVWDGATKLNLGSKSDTLGGNKSNVGQGQAKSNTGT